MASSIYFQHAGEASGTPVIALHGLFGSLENLGVITRQLATSYSVYSLDLPGHGRSALGGAHLSLSSMAESIVAWMEQQNIAKAHFLGHSLGGKVSMEVALRYPKKVASLVVADIAPVAYKPRHDDVFAAFAAVDLASITTRLDADKAMRTHIGELSTRSFLLKNLEKVDGIWVWRINIEALQASYPQFIGANTSSLPAYTNPVLFIKGELSEYMLPEHKTQILNLFPKASVKVINGTHHWLHAEKPDIFSGIVQRFLQSHA